MEQLNAKDELVTISDLMEKWGINRTSVMKRLQKYGITPEVEAGQGTGNSKIPAKYSWNKILKAESDVTNGNITFALEKVSEEAAVMTTTDIVAKELQKLDARHDSYAISQKLGLLEMMAQSARKTIEHIEREKAQKVTQLETQLAIKQIELEAKEQEVELKQIQLDESAKWFSLKKYNDVFGIPNFEGKSNQSKAGHYVRNICLQQGEKRIQIPDNNYGNVWVYRVEFLHSIYHKELL